MNVNTYKIPKISEPRLKVFLSHALDPKRKIGQNILKFTFKKDSKGYYRGKLKLDSKLNSFSYTKKYLDAF